MSQELKRLWIISILFSAIAALGVFALKPFTDSLQFLPDEGFNWYYWKLSDPTFMSRFTSWGLYFAHQIFVWWMIYYATLRKRELSDWSKPHRVNYWLLGGTAVFIALHYVQTAIWFDGLAQDMPVVLSQLSVVIMLILILIMEAPRRGLFFGYGKSWFRSVQPFLFRTHGYLFSWALVFTFWYHPMYPTWGHVTGFFYMFLIFAQMGLMYTAVHVNRPWTFAMEALVVLHAVVMANVNAARQDEPSMWAMFGFGFAMLIVITQIYGLAMKNWVRWALLGIYALAVIVVYSYRGWDNLNEIFRIPAFDYIGVFLIGGVFILFLWAKPKNTDPAE